MIRKANQAEILALGTAADALHMVGLRHTIQLGWSKPHDGDMVLAADETVDAYDCMEAASALAGMAGIKAMQAGESRLTVSHALWAMLVSVATDLGLSDEEFDQGREMTLKDIEVALRDDKK
ncbi:hypothetical protein ACTUHY_00505 [Acidaminococcus sp. LBK-2]